MSDAMPGFILFGVMGLVYIIPTIIAAKRNHPNVAAIFLLNLLLGWSLIGWVAALVWSAMAFTPPPKPAARHDTDKEYYF